MARTLQAALLEYLRDQRTLFHADPATADVDEEAPPGWDNASLLAEMQASDRIGRRA